MKASDLKIHNMEQRSPEWYAIRAGRLTGSIANKLVTPTGRKSTQYRGEIARILAESKGWQRPEQTPDSYWMARGRELEDDARGWLQVETGKEVSQCGFIEHPNPLLGFSPDGYFMDGEHMIPVELKCPKPSNHLSWLIEGGVPKEHLPQCHYAMVVTGAPYMMFMSYHPEAPCVVQTVTESEMTDLVLTQLLAFVQEFEAAHMELFGTSYIEEML